MKKMKKLLSALTALAIIASAFAGLAIPANAAAQVYVDENFDSYEAGQIIKSAGKYDKDGETIDEAKPDPVTKGSIVYYAGKRGNGVSNNSATISAVDAEDETQGKQLVISNDGAASASRGIRMTFADTAAVPLATAIESGENLEFSFKFKSAQPFEILGKYTGDDTYGNPTDEVFGSYTTDDLTTTDSYVKVRAIIDKDASKQYLIVTDLDGKVLNTKSAALTASTIGGIRFWSNNSGKSAYMDDIKVETKTDDIADVTLSVKEDTTGLEGATVKIGDYTLTTGADGTVTIPLPNGTYTAVAHASGKEHTLGEKDDHTVEFTVNASENNTQTVDFTLQQMNYIKVPDTVEINGGQNFIAAPKGDAANTTKAFTVYVADQEKVPMTSDEYGLTWSIYPHGTETADPNVTIDSKGVVSVTKGFTTDKTALAYDVTAVAATDDRNQKVTKTLYVGNMDILYYEPINLVIPSAATDKEYRLTTADIADGSVAFPSMSEVYVNVTFGELGGDSNAVRTFGIVTDSGNLVGLQYSKTDDGTQIVAWTGWGKNDMNASSSKGGYTNGQTLIENYTNDTPIDVSFVIDRTNKAITVSSGANTVSLPIPDSLQKDTLKFTGFRAGQYRSKNALTISSVTVREPNEDYLSISGDNKLAKVYGTAVEREYILGQSVIVPDEEFTWTVDAPANAEADAVTIADGKLSVKDTATPGTYTIKAQSGTRTAKKAEFPVYIGDFRTDGDTDTDSGVTRNMEMTISGAYAYDPALYEEGSGLETSITTAVDASGDTIKVTSAKDQNAVLIQASYDNITNVLTSVKTDNVTLTKGDNTLTNVTKVNGAKVMLWNALNTTDGLKSVIGETSLVSDNTVGTYSVVKVRDTYDDDVTDILPDAVWSSSNESVATVNASTGAVTLVAPGQTTITATINNGTKADGSAAKLTKTIPLTVSTYSITGEADGNSTTVDTSAIVTGDDVAKYMVTTATSAGKKVKQTEVSKTDLIKADYAVDTTGADKYEIVPIYEKAIGDAGTLGAYDNGYKFPVPDDTYNFEVTVSGSRCDVYANNQMLVNNILQGGSVGNTIKVNDIKVADGVANITTADYASGATSANSNVTVKVYKSPSIVTRERKMYVLGDSLVCIYYNGGSDDNVTAQTGWGQVMDKFVKNVDIVNLANSGATANGLYGSAFSQIVTSGEKDDILILESGYNDRTYDTEETMKNAVTQMVTQAKAKGMKVVLVSPNASQHDYNDHVSWTGKMEAVATATNTDYINLAKLSYDYLYATYGSDTDTVKSSFCVSDGLHSQYRGAVKFASIVAGQLLGCTEDYSDIVDTSASYTYKDSKNADIVCKAEAPASSGN